VDDGHATYLLSFSPDQPADGQYHAITVKLSGKQHGLTLHYRTGYLYTKEPATLKERFQQAVWQPADANELTVAAKVIPHGRRRQHEDQHCGWRAGCERGSRSAGWTIWMSSSSSATMRAFMRRLRGKRWGCGSSPRHTSKLLSTGIPYEHVVQLKRGVASLRILVVDKNSGRMGSVTIPVSAFGPDKR
jgi:hypothetical protein